MYEKYYKKLCELIEEKTGLKIGYGFCINPLNISPVEIVRLESFIHNNKLFDTNIIFRDFQGEMNACLQSDERS